MNYQPAQKPTFYFIGVTTGKSSIMRVFPAWAKHLGLGDVEIKGIDLKIHDEPERYREAVSFIKNDPLSLGALVTTHKLDLLKASRDLFEELDPYAQLTGEISCISKRDGKLAGHAKDPITAGFSLEAFLPLDHWEKSGAEVLVLGAGGSSVALTCYMLEPRHGANRPSRIVVTNRSQPRLTEIEEIHRRLAQPVPIEYHLAPQPESAAALMATLKPRSLVVNATGLGKDAPGSPITGGAVFPQDGFAWEFNYRGDLVFLDQARAQEKNLHVEDGWIYFIHGWTRVIAEVFHIDIPTRGPAFDRIAQIAQDVR
ncbi:MAG: shikimate dehydrogenase [Verrucomicrobiae bacterium]